MDFGFVFILFLFFLPSPQHDGLNWASLVLSVKQPININYCQPIQFKPTPNIYSLLCVYPNLISYSSMLLLSIKTRVTLLPCPLVICSFITMNTHTHTHNVFLIHSCILSCYPQYLQKHQMWIITPLKIVPNKYTPPLVWVTFDKTCGDQQL